MDIPKNYLVDARKALPRFPEIKRYCEALLPAIAAQLTTNESLHIITAAEHSSNPALIQHPNLSLHSTAASPGTLKSAWAVQQLLKELKPDVYHCAEMYTVCSGKIKTVTTIHEACPLTLPLNLATLKRKLLFRVITQYKLRRVSEIIAISANILQSYPTRVNRNRSTVIHYGTAAEFKPQEPETVETVKAKYTLPRKFMLIIEADNDIHNLITILDAIQATDYTETAPLVIAGYGSQNANITRLIKQRKLSTRVHQIGEIEKKDMPALYCAAYALLFPNRVTGNGLPILEAMACGTPVICASLPSLTEITGEAATLVHPTDKQEWRRAINTAMLSLEWHDESRANSLKHAQRFTWDKAAAATLAVYRGLGSR
ncbi:MAG: glycosyltransferase family 1 protein [Kiritimatiellae bacterium]|nr:glycosyltransferase family 1 protein [Kiritimatiellia bacterium]